MDSSSSTSSSPPVPGPSDSQPPASDAHWRTTCRTCGDSFKSRNQLMRHLYRAHPRDKPKSSSRAAQAVPHTLPASATSNPEGSQSQVHPYILLPPEQQLAFAARIMFAVFAVGMKQVEEEQAKHQGQQQQQKQAEDVPLESHQERNQEMNQQGNQERSEERRKERRKERSKMRSKEGSKENREKSQERNQGEGRSHKLDPSRPPFIPSLPPKDGTAPGPEPKSRDSNVAVTAQPTPGQTHQGTPKNDSESEDSDDEDGGVMLHAPELETLPVRSFHPGQRARDGAASGIERRP